MWKRDRDRLIERGRESKKETGREREMRRKIHGYKKRDCKQERIYVRE